MRKAALFYNPLSGRHRERRTGDVESALRILREAGIEISGSPTLGAAETAEQVRQAVSEDCDTIFACGGDGTVHDVLQAIVGTNAALGIIPLGTANTLAHDLGLPLSPVPAAHAALQATPRRISVGKVEYRDFSGKAASRYFTVTAGVGVDAHLFYKLSAQAKKQLGMVAYYAKATRLWLRHPLETFAADFEDAGEPRQAIISQALAVRIRFFGGILRELAPGASLERDDLRLVLFKTRSRIAYLRYILRGLFGQVWTIPEIELVHSKRLSCRPLRDTPADSRIFVEADGELLGTLPVEISMVVNSLTLLTLPRNLD